MTATAARVAPPPAASPSSQVELILAQVNSLPTLPAVAIQLIERTTDESAGLRDLVELLGSDQSLAARILSVARRANLGAQADTIERAVQVLGFNGVRNLVLSVQVFDTFSQRVEKGSGRFDRTGFWKHSLAVACAARLLAEHVPLAAGKDCPLPKPEEMFLCGLVHDLGKVVFDACFPKTYERVISNVEASKGVIADAERDVFGVDHALAGRRLASHWKLPQMLEECMWLHHHAPATLPSRIGFAEHVRLVHLADRLARQMRIGYSGNHRVDASLAEIGKALTVPVELLERVVRELPALIDARAALIGLDRITSNELYQGALTEANAELARMNRTLAESNRRLASRSRCFEALSQLTAGLGAQPSHEDVARRAASALRVLLRDRSVAVTVFSAARSVLILCAHKATDIAESTEVLPAPTIPHESMAKLGTGWWPISLLPTTLGDRVLAALGGGPASCQLIRRHDATLGLLSVSGDAPTDLGDSIGYLSDALGAWLGTAEAAAVASRLNEELLDINQRLVGSQAELARVRALAAAGEMAAGAAHELNNPLAVISGRAQLLDRDDVPEDVRRTVRVIGEHAHKASAIVNELMDFAKPAPPVPAVWSMAELWAEVRKEWLDRAGWEGKKFRLEVSDGTALVHADRSQVRLLLDELLRNALEAMRDAPEPLLIVNCRADVADGRIVVTIRDNGCGMTPDVLEHATTPFFSHRAAGRGRGLGLSRAMRYAEINGGGITLDSRPGEGTVITLELPAADAR